MDGDYDGSYDNALRFYEESGANALDLAHESSRIRCICGARVADEIELRVHQHYDHAATALAA